ncbi:hypothetical protein KMW28_21830 [Flammeovirga yaeyamensis]|uniref:Class I SAM-dependent methyltransferase n=1 Tax=Flammeovirga yaeyamensis TaxID=367791 RepID=A0AAX1NC86_9BACT|nr:hypothetical protein [Flammeovirga yaeyamensis]MBB3697004.1 hypothetical protein [Flammeovirga yaeyamensis]NMF33667.1 hypothetical protein [Flammeovirga yaeyamensis]QWG05067.1 hypothetical protein KMW28_21830 [Flammeovirga yaeyamensis]
MGRLQLFEFEDQQWFPSMIRNYGTDFLQFLANKTKMFAPAVGILNEVMEQSNTTKIIDLASGGGGSWLFLNEELRKVKPETNITLTDYYPNLPAFKRTSALADNIYYKNEAVDATNVPSDLQGIRTQFLSLHHFDEKSAVKILQNAVDAQQPIAIFEGQERSIPSVIGMLFSPITLWLVTLFIRPFKLGRVFFTYLFPIVPPFVMWDGIVSALRTYSVDEMKGLVSKVEGNEHYEWKIDKVKNGPGVVLFLVGWPKI